MFDCPTLRTSMDLAPEQVNDLTRREIEMWNKVVRDQKIKEGS